MKLPKNVVSVKCLLTEELAGSMPSYEIKCILLFHISESKNSFVNAIYEDDTCLRSCLELFLTFYNILDYLYTYIYIIYN